MAEPPSTPEQSEPSPFWTSKPFRLFVIVVVVGISVGIFAFRDQFAEFVKTLEEQAKAMGIDPERARDRIVMRLELT